MKFLKPQLQTLTLMGGKDPAVLFAAMDSLCRPFFTGLSFRWTRESPRSGALELHATYSLDAAAVAACGVTTSTPRVYW